MNLWPFLEPSPIPPLPWEWLQPAMEGVAWAVLHHPGAERGGDASPPATARDAHREPGRESSPRQLLTRTLCSYHGLVFPHPELLSI